MKTLTEIRQEIEKGCNCKNAWGDICGVSYHDQKEIICYCEECSAKLELLNEIEPLVIKKKKVFEKFDEYSCIKNDAWYLEWKKELGVEE